MEFQLISLAINTTAGAAVNMVGYSQIVGAASISTSDLNSVVFSTGAPLSFDKATAPDRAVEGPNPHGATDGSIDRRDTAAADEAELSDNHFSEIAAVSGLFHSKEFELSLSADNYKLYSKSRACVYPDSFLRSLDGGRDDCDVIKPGGAESDILTLPFLAISGWAVIILIVAGLYRFYGNWRVKRWLRQAGARGGGVSTANPARRSRPRGKSRSRRYAG